MVLAHEKTNRIRGRRVVHEQKPECLSGGLSCGGKCVPYIAVLKVKENTMEKE